jgi:hypothetical protein
MNPSKIETKSTRRNRGTRATIVATLGGIVLAAAGIFAPPVARSPTR